MRLILTTLIHSFRLRDKSVHLHECSPFWERIFVIFCKENYYIYSRSSAFFYHVIRKTHHRNTYQQGNKLVYLCFQGFGPQCGSLFEFLLPVIKLSTDTSLPEHVYLMDDGLELWHTTLINTTRITPPLLHLYKNMAELLRK